MKSSSFTRKLTGVLTALALSMGFVMATANDAAAQTTSDEEAAGAALVLTTTIGGITTTIGGIVLTVVLVSKDDDDNKEAMKVYIENNGLAMQQDITMGAGGTVDDLAEAFGVPESEHTAFGRALRARQADLVDLTDAREINEERAGEFIEQVNAAILSNDELARRMYEPADTSG
jgi:hypothetical protein